MGLNWTEPNPSILLTPSKWESKPPLNQVFFDPIRRDFYGKSFKPNLKIADLTQPNPSSKNSPDSTRIKNSWPGPIISILTHEPNLIYPFLSRDEITRCNNWILCILWWTNPIQLEKRRQRMVGWTAAFAGTECTLWRTSKYYWLSG